MATGFFGQQELARRNTRILVVLFTLAVLILIILTNLLVMFSLGFIEYSDFSYPALISLETIGWISLLVIGSVLIAILLKWQQLRHGGKVVARSLGGTLIPTDTTDPHLRRVLNITEEMALAAQVPVPPVYLLPEQGINAFAAGYSPADAVIGVTKGCIEQLNRDELQGVIAHEFSHILNGDMRMNIRLIAILSGILFIGHAGYVLLRASSGRRVRSSSNNKNNGAAAIVLLGLGLLVIGYAGTFFGNLIKAAVSRQREFLADASAVQFTRNPAGIAGALKRIGAYNEGSQIHNEAADEISHMFFSEAISSWASIFSTHPPLATRIKRIEPAWNGEYLSPHVITESSQETSPTPRPSAEALLPLLLIDMTHQQKSAQAIVLAVLLQEQTARQLLPELQQQAPELANQAAKLSEQLKNLSLTEKVRLLQRCIPALKELYQQDFELFERWLQRVIQADGKVDLLEWIAASFVEHTVAAQFRQQHVIRSTSARSLQALQPALLPLLIALANTAAPAQQLTVWKNALAMQEFAEPRPLPATDYQALSKATAELMAAGPAVKEQIWQQIQDAVTTNGNTADEQQALLLALSLLLEIPSQL